MIITYGYHLELRYKIPIYAMHIWYDYYRYVLVFNSFKLIIAYNLDFLLLSIVVIISLNDVFFHYLRIIDI